MTQLTLKDIKPNSKYDWIVYVRYSFSNWPVGQVVSRHLTPEAASKACNSTFYGIAHRDEL